MITSKTIWDLAEVVERAEMVLLEMGPNVPENMRRAALGPDMKVLLVEALRKLATERT